MAGEPLSIIRIYASDRAKHFNVGRSVISWPMIRFAGIRGNIYALILIETSIHTEIRKYIHPCTRARRFSYSGRHTKAHTHWKI